MNLLILIVGPSGSGKTTLEKKLEKNYPNYYKRIISYTTRKPRNNEENGKDYYFVSKRKFSKMEKEKKFIEVNEFNDNKYGCKIPENNENKDLLLVVDTNGMQEILKAFNENLELKGKYKPLVIYMDILEKDLKENMKNRGDDLVEIEKRIKIAKKEKEKFKNSNIIPDIVIKKLYPCLYKDVHNQLLLYKNIYNHKNRL